MYIQKSAQSDIILPFVLHWIVKYHFLCNLLTI